jgi:succinate dehydrogenase/fumarate reductase flavoprotein subunit
MSSQEDNKRSEHANSDKSGQSFSRRKFLGGVAGASAALTVSGLLAGCGDKTAPGTSNVVPTVQVTAGADGVTRPFGVYEADVLIIGGGISGLFAAKKAMEEGATVIIVDKGPFGHSGTSGINWGHDMETNEWSSDDGSSTLGANIFLNDGLVDQDYDLSLSQHVHEARPVMTNEMMGLFAERDLEGNSIGQNADAAMTVDHGCFPRAWAQYARRKGAKIIDRTMVTEILLSDDGQAAGAVGYSQVTGDAFVFRAKSVIMATGSYAWCYGWTGNTACTISGPENTGDGQSMFIKLGLEMRDMEQLPFDCVQIYPHSTAYGMGTLGLSIVNHQYALNKNQERYTQMLDDSAIAGSNAIFMRLTMKEINEGRGLDNGCVYLDTVDLDKLNRYYRRARSRNMRIGYVLPDKAELHWEFWETAARPASTGTTGETGISGLYYAGTSTEAYSGCGFFACVGSGYMCGKFASQRALGMDRPAVNWSKVQDALASIYGTLEAAPANGQRPLAVYHKIQQAMYAGLSPLRDEAGIQGVIDALNQIKEQDMPFLNVPSKSRRYNMEWRQALEIPNMWNCVMGTAQAALIRKETRGTHCRTDFPRMDNANWLVNTIVKQDNGAWTAETRPIVATIVSAADVAAMVPELGLEF